MARKDEGVSNESIPSPELPGLDDDRDGGDMSMFSHLQGNEEKLRLEAKYLHHESSEDESASLTPVPVSVTTDYLTCTVSSSGLKHPTSRRVTPSPKGTRKVSTIDRIKKGASASPLNSSTSPSRISDRLSDSVLGHDLSDEGHNLTTVSTPQLSIAGTSSRGFSDEDLEKPRLKYPAVGPKDALVLSEPGEPVIQVPGTINQYLREYQRDGVRFLYQHFRSEDGALLADDMGLGKTVQVISFMAAVLGKTGTKEDVLRQRPKFIRKLSDPEDKMSADDTRPRRTFLIIGPMSVLYNWVDELETWGHFIVGKYHKTHKSNTLADMKKGKLDVVVTTYETFRDHIDELNSFCWCCVIADEVQKIKGMKSEVTVSLKKLDCDRRFGLTGTALQNSLAELWCLLDWANPGCLGSITDFNAKFARAIECGQKHDATKRELAIARKAKAKFSELKSKWMLRRTKSLIAEQLPKKEELVVYCKPTSFQLSIYKTILDRDDMKLILLQNDPCDCGSGNKRIKCCYKKTCDGRPVSVLTLVYMSLLLKASNHIALLLPNKTNSDSQKKYAAEVCESVFTSYPEFLQQSNEAAYRTLSDPQYCGKMKVLQGLLSVFKKQNSKVLLFSNSVRLLDIVEQFSVCKAYEYRRLDGKTPDIKRIQRVQEFNSDPNLFLFLISIKAGGVGLNMTGANVVIIFDPNWNPTHDLQAQDRAYRIGQARDVRVFRLISVGTIEENMYLRQIYKQQLDNVAVSSQNAVRYFHGIAGDKKNPGELFGINNLFTLRTGNSCLTEDILQRNKKVEAGVKGFHVSHYVPPAAAAETDDNEDDVSRAALFPCQSDSECEDAESSHDLSNAEANSNMQEQPIHDRVKKENEDFENPYEEMCHFVIDDLSQPKHETKDRHDNIKCENQIPKDKNHIISHSAKPSHGMSVTGRSSGQNNMKRKLEPKRSGIKNDRIEYLSSDEEGENKKSKKYSTAKNTRSSNKDARFDNEVPQSFASVSDVFDVCGVVHLHENKKVIGSSRAEDHMSRCAVTDVYELHQHTQQLAMNCDPLSESSGNESDDLGVNEKGQKQPDRSQKSQEKRSPLPEGHVTCVTTEKDTKICTDRRAKALVIKNKRVLIGQTPKAIRMQHFRGLMKSQHATDVAVFAEAVLRSSHTQRQEMLKTYYVSQDRQLEEAFVQPDEPDKKLKMSKVKQKQSHKTLKNTKTKPGSKSKQNANRRQMNKSRDRRKQIDFLDTQSDHSENNQSDQSLINDNEDPRIKIFGDKLRKARTARKHRTKTQENAAEIRVTASDNLILKTKETSAECKYLSETSEHEDSEFERQQKNKNASVKNNYDNKPCIPASNPLLDKIFLYESQTESAKKPPPKQKKYCNLKDQTIIDEIENSNADHKDNDEHNENVNSQSKLETIIEHRRNDDTLASDVKQPSKSNECHESYNTYDSEFDWLFSEGTIKRQRKSLDN